MANEEHLKILRQGVEVWNNWRKKHPRIKPDLFEANLGSMDLSRTNLSGAELGNAYLGRRRTFPMLISPWHP